MVTKKIAQRVSTFKLAMQDSASLLGEKKEDRGVRIENGWKTFLGLNSQDYFKRKNSVSFSLNFFTSRK